jgi:hypothetical protein
MRELYFWVLAAQQGKDHVGTAAIGCPGQCPAICRGPAMVQLHDDELMIAAK